MKKINGMEVGGVRVFSELGSQMAFVLTFIFDPDNKFRKKVEYKKLIKVTKGTKRVFDKQAKAWAHNKLILFGNEYYILLERQDKFRFKRYIVDEENVPVHAPKPPNTGKYERFRKELQYLNSKTVKNFRFKGKTVYRSEGDYGVENTIHPNVSVYSANYIK